MGHFVMGLRAALCPHEQVSFSPIGRERRLVPEVGVALGERQRLVVVGETEGWVEDAVRPPVGSAETPRAQRASHHGEKLRPMALAAGRMVGGGSIFS